MNDQVSPFRRISERSWDLPGVPADFAHVAQDAVDLALAELADRRATLASLHKGDHETAIDRFTVEVRKQSDSVRRTAALLGDDIVVVAANTLGRAATAEDVVAHAQGLIAAIDQMLNRWRAIDECSRAPNTRVIQGSTS